MKLTYGNVFGKWSDYYLSNVLIWRWPPDTWLTAHELMSLTFVLLVREGSVLLDKWHSMWFKQFKLSLGLNGFLFQKYYLRGFERWLSFCCFCKGSEFDSKHSCDDFNYVQCQLHGSESLFWVPQVTGLWWTYINEGNTFIYIILIHSSSVLCKFVLPLS